MNMLIFHTEKIIMDIANCKKKLNFECMHLNLKQILLLFKFPA